MRKLNLVLPSVLIVVGSLHLAHAQFGFSGGGVNSQGEDFLHVMTTDLVVAVSPQHKIAWAFARGSAEWVPQDLKGDNFQSPMVVGSVAVVRSDKGTYVFNRASAEWKPLEIGPANMAVADDGSGMLLVQAEDSVHVFVPEEDRWISAEAPAKQPEAVPAS